LDWDFPVPFLPKNKRRWGSYGAGVQLFFPAVLLVICGAFLFFQGLLGGK